MKTTISKILFPFFLLVGFSISMFGQAAANKGAVIIVSQEGPVRVSDGEGKQIQFEKGLVGQVVKEGQYVQAGIGGKVILLLSNGTVVTLQSQTKMKIGTFEQEPFDAGNKKISDLEGEPSVSKVNIELDWGSLVVKTKKLDKSSSFDISSPVGTAGIRGTEFQMSQNPNTGVQLDVTESTVAFTPPGGGGAIPVTEGGGLDVSSAGTPTQRPVNPVVAQNISVTNEAATQVVDDVSLGAVSDAMVEASAEESEQVQDEQPEQEDSETGEESDSDGDTDSETEGDSPGDDAGGSESTDSTSDSEQVQTEPIAALESDLAMAAPEIEISDVLENNSEVSQARKTGKVNANSKQLATFGLNVDQTLRFHTFSNEVQGSLLKENKAALTRLLNMNGFGQQQAVVYYGYSADLRKSILNLVDTAIVSLLTQALDENLLSSTLTDENLAASNPNNNPEASPSNDLDSKLLDLGNKLRNSGNGEILEELVSLSGGNMDETWLRTGEVANILLQDYSLSSTIAMQTLSSEEVLKNPFYQEVSSLYGILENDQLVAGPATFIGAKNLSIDNGVFDPTVSLLGTSNTLVLSASEQINLTGSLNWDSLGYDSPRVVVMSGNKINASKGVSLKSATSDLLVAARHDVLFEDAQLESAREIAIRSLRDVQLLNVQLGASSKASIEAMRDLNVDGLRFSSEIPSILMQATTLRLSNVEFPATSMVQLNSLKGAIDGKYPNFGSSIPSADQVGRVNFINNVSSGGNVLNTRQAFDQYGGNISIGKMVNP